MAIRPYYSHAGIEIFHGDCQEILPGLKADLLCTDPPYGIGVGRAMHQKSGQLNGHGHRRVAVRTYELSTWDDAPPSPEVISCARSTSECQIIFGGNYFDLPPSRCWLVWDKENGDNEYADCELAWTNLDKPIRRLSWLWHGFARKGAEDRFDHPTQKPLGLMKWCIEQAPDTCRTILDPFCGTGTTLVAAKALGRTAYGIEIEEKYCEIAAKRLSQEVFDFGGAQ